jgi:hypothetical protein
MYSNSIISFNFPSYFPYGAKMQNITFNGILNSINTESSVCVFYFNNNIIQTNGLTYDNVNIINNLPTINGINTISCVGNSSFSNSSAILSFASIIIDIIFLIYKIQKHNGYYS